MNPALVFDTLLEASGRALLVAGFVAIALAVFRTKAPALRHNAWTAALAIMLVLPVMSGWMPTIPIPLGFPAPAVERNAAAIPAVSAAHNSLPPSPTTRSSSDAPISAGLKSTASTPLSLVHSTAPATSARPDWRLNAVFVWCVVAFVILLREAVGWWFAHRLAAQGVPAAIGDGTFESERVTTPVVTGVLRPRVLVPSSWSQWGSGVRRMVLAHEAAHVDRRDPLVAALARVNRAIFWFHPLAWWLERHLSRLAERACDEVVIREMNGSRLYAALLVEMAHRLQRHGRRVAWQGMGIVSSRPFEDRLDRILQGPAPDLSRRSKIALATVCGALMAIGVACGTAAAPLNEDPELATKITAAVAGFANYETAKTMSLEQVAELEKVVATNPDDLNATQTLLIFYLSRGQKLMGWNQMVAAQRPHLLRMIERHPESSLVTWRVSRRLDPEGYEKARALWLTHVERPDASLAVLSQGAAFFERVEKPLAEQLLLRAEAMDPKGPIPRRSVTGVLRPSWSERLGKLYAMAISGSHDQTAWDDVTTADAVQLQSEFATQARQKLDQSDDPALLLEAGIFLIYSAAKAKLDFDPAALGREYVAKSLKLDPTSVEAKRILTEPPFNFEDFMKNRSAKTEQMRQRLGRPVDELDHASFEQIPAATKLEYAQMLLWSPYSQAMVSYRKKDEKGVEAAFASLKDRADALQKLVDNPPSAVPAGLQFDLHIALGTCAMHQGSSREAVRRLGLALSAASAGFPTERVSLSSAADKLAYDLLDAGERESVAVFYDSMAKRFANDSRTTYEQAAKAIREGRMPRDYQRYRAGLE